MMKDQYLPHDAGAMGNGKIMELIAEYGMEGYGIYWMIMEHLRQQNGYKSNMTRMKILAGKAGISIIKLKNVLCDFELFIIEDEQIYSPGLSKRMKPLDEKRAKCKANGSKGGKANALKINNGNSSDAKAVKESKERKVSNNIIRDDNPPTAAAVVGIKGKLGKVHRRPCPRAGVVRAYGNALGLAERLREILPRNHPHVQRPHPLLWQRGKHFHPERCEELFQ